jgi:putative endonuclease
MVFFVYILYSEGFDRYYIGQTSDISSRLIGHNAGYESSTSPYAPWTLVCCVVKPNRGEAMILERKLKNLNRIKLEQFINKYGVNLS